MQTQPVSEIGRGGSGALIASVLRPGGRFLAESLAMCIGVMCVVGGALSIAAFSVAGLLGYPNLARESPELSILLNAILLALAMAVYMHVRRHGLRHNLVMSGSTLVVGVVLVGALWTGIVAAGSVSSRGSAFGLVCGPACLVMLVIMLFNFGMYSGRARHAQAR
jgi:hypothetical protein